MYLALHVYIEIYGQHSKINFIHYSYIQIGEYMHKFTHIMMLKIRIILLQIILS